MDVRGSLEEEPVTAGRHCQQVCVSASHTPNLPLEVQLTRVAILLTLLATAAFLWKMAQTWVPAVQTHSLRSVLEVSLYVGFVGFLIYGNLLYQLTRMGYLRRLRMPHGAPDDEHGIGDNDAAPALTFLIPSYKEGARVIRQALLSAALQEYPNREVVLL